MPYGPYEDRHPHHANAEFVAAEIDGDEQLHAGGRGAGQPLLRDDLPVRPNRFPSHPHPGPCHYLSTTGEEAVAGACQGVVPESIHLRAARRKARSGRSGAGVRGANVPPAWPGVPRSSKVMAGSAGTAVSQASTRGFANCVTSRPGRRPLGGEGGIPQRELAMRGTCARQPNRPPAPCVQLTASPSPRAQLGAPPKSAPRPFRLVEGLPAARPRSPRLHRRATGRRRRTSRGGGTVRNTWLARGEAHMAFCTPFCNRIR